MVDRDPIRRPALRGPRDMSSAADLKKAGLKSTVPRRKILEVLESARREREFHVVLLSNTIHAL